MVLFINQKNYKEGTIKFFVKLDSKGRIVIPSEIRRSLDIRPDDILMVLFSLKNGINIVKYDGCSSVTGSITDCGFVGSGSNPGCSRKRGD